MKTCSSALVVTPFAGRQHVRPELNLAPNSSHSHSRSASNSGPFLVDDNPAPPTVKQTMRNTSGWNNGQPVKATAAISAHPTTHNNAVLSSEQMNTPFSYFSNSNAMPRRSSYHNTTPGSQVSLPEPVDRRTSVAGSRLPNALSDIQLSSNNSSNSIPRSAVRHIRPISPFAQPEVAALDPNLDSLPTPAKDTPHPVIVIASSSPLPTKRSLLDKETPRKRRAVE